MDQYTLVSGDVYYLSFYLKERDPTTGSVTPYDLSTANSIWFRMREYGQSTNTISVQMSTVSSPSCTLGFCRVLATIPSAGKYYSEVEVYEGTENKTWKGPVYIIKEALG
jgi:hypothetical protein